MNPYKFLFPVLFLPALLSAQEQSFEIIGKITGDHKDKIYLFFEDQLDQKDSLSAPVKDGSFYFNLKYNLPVLCRLHFGENTNIQDLYIDGRVTTVTLSCDLSDLETPDSLGGPRTEFQISGVSGSATEGIKRDFEAWRSQLENSDRSEEQKHTEYFSKLQSVVALNPKSRASAYLIAGRIFLVGNSFMMMGKFPLSYTEVNQLAGMLDSSMHSSLEWKNLSRLMQRLNLERNRSVGNVFIDTPLKDTLNRTVRIKSFRNKYVLVDFWASWCTPCRALNPELKRLYAQYGKKGFEIVGISLDAETDKWKEAIWKDVLTWPQVIDEMGFNGELAKHYDIYGIPLKVLLDREGKIVGFDLSVEEVEKLLGKLL